LREGWAWACPPYALKGRVNHKQPNSDVTGASPSEVEGVKRGLKVAYRPLAREDFDHLLLAHGQPWPNDGRAALRVEAETYSNSPLDANGGLAAAITLSGWAQVAAPHPLDRPAARSRPSEARRTAFQREPDRRPP
jgi:hypothetical protein